MEQNILRKYAKFLIEDCLKVKKGQPLLVAGNVLNEDFVNLIIEESKKLETGKVYTILKDSFAERDLFLTKSYEECMKSPLFDRHLYNVIAKEGGALLSLTSPIPHINDGVDSSLLQKIAAEMERRISGFREKQHTGDLPWCIAGVSNPYWAKEVFPNEENAEDLLWEQILSICMMDKENPGKVWMDYFDTLKKRCEVLNEAKIKTLHYEASNGTNITFELPENYVFASAKGHDYIVNMPSLEMFTTPYKYGTNGIVYSSKPLLYQGVKIDEFWIRFQDGRIVEAKAKENDEHLQKLIGLDEGSHYLGEVSFVDFDSRINRSGILYLNTLFDENACCHLAIGKGFPECFINGQSKSIEELKEMGMNDSLTHVDFMIGTRDLKIVATLLDGSEMTLMEHGTLVI